MRLFFAFPIPSEKRNELRGQLDPVVSASSGIRWTNADSFHITAHFLGEVPPAGLERLRAVMRGFVPSVAPVSAEYAGIGRFPPRGRASVIVVPVTKNGEKLGSLQREIGDRISGVFPLDTRRYTPHITVGRARNHETPSLVIPDGVRVSGCFAVSSFVLFSSDLRPGGPVYAPVFEIPLTGGA